MEPSKIGLTINDVGIADALSRWQLSVPLNQRPYAWTDDPVETLLHDLTKAFDVAQPIYFLGTIVLTEASKGVREVADGQQRLATISILISAIRDYLVELGDQQGADQYQSDFLIKYDPPSGQYRPKLHLNVQDDQYFFSNILLPPKDRVLDTKKIFSSNDRLHNAASQARDHVRKLTAALPDKEKPKRLYQWIEYLKDSALIIAITVPQRVSSSFRMFETLNARGVRASQVDILKNYLLDLSGDAKSTAHSHWMSMLSVIESHGGDELVLDFIRHLWISQHGPTTENELGDSFENKIRSERQALDFLSLLDSAAPDYVAILTPLQSPRWAAFTSDTRKTIDIITNDLGGQQIRPLMLSVTRHFQQNEAAKAFRSFLSWSVRFLIVGGAGGGKLERYYGLRAFEVTKGEVSTVKGLIDKMNGSLPRDKQFEEEFSRATVKKTNLARYYLRTIENYRAGEKLPQLLINEDPNAVNLEHVLPVTPSEGWDLDAETASTFYKRIGNMVLLGSKDNVELGNKSFEEKRKILAASPLNVTNEVASYATWGPDEIKARQSLLAADVAKVWPL
ncbi:MAG: DUF262 domain-containing HNH endonuclease family protein [Pseudomonadota bacterium]